MTSRRRLVIGLCAASAASAAFAACSGDLVGPPPAADHASIFDDVWREFDLHYSFFQLKGIDWNAVGAKHRAAALAATTDKAFAGEIAAMLAELKDPHVSLTPFGPGSTIRYIAPYDTVPTHYNERATLAHYVPNALVTAGGAGHIRYGMASPTVGYLRIASFIGDDWSGEVDEALGAMQAATSIIVDIRGNGGGNRNVAFGIADRFLDRDRTLGYLRYRNGSGHGDFTGYVTETVGPKGGRRFSGPVYILTNRGDYSSAEDFVLAMRVRPLTTVVGDTTGGASGGPIVRELPNGWTFELSQWIEYTPDRQTFEGRGLAPDIVVKPPAIAPLVAGKDVVVDQALSLAAIGR
ncbi:MAG: S41 family peptidase [Gemmatimonadaceae bacterium]